GTKKSCRADKEGSHVSTRFGAHRRRGRSVGGNAGRRDRLGDDSRNGRSDSGLLQGEERSTPPRRCVFAKQAQRAPFGLQTVRVVDQLESARSSRNPGTSGTPRTEGGQG